MSSIVTALAGRVQQHTVRLNSRVSSVYPSAEGRWRLDIDERAAAEPFDAVIVALPAFAAAATLNTVDRQLADELGAIPHAGCAVVSCAFRREQIGRALDSFGFVVPQIEGRRIVAASFASQKFPGRAPVGCVLVRAFVGGSMRPELVELSDDELRRLVVDELGELLAITGLPEWMDIARWPRSMPQYLVGHVERVERIERLAARWPTMALAGNAYHGVGVPQCIASGEAAAERMALLFLDV